VKLRRFALSSCLVAVLSLVIAAGGGDDDDARSAEGGTLTIYSSLPLQGDFLPQSEDIVRAFELALEQHGGQAGDATIAYVSLDGASVETGGPDPDAVSANAERAAGDETTIAYLGEFNSFASRISIPILNEAGILQISPSNTSVGLTRAEGAEAGEPDMYYPTGERTYGRVVPAEHTQAAALVAYMKGQECTGVYILHDDLPYGMGMAEMVEAYAAEQQLEVLGNDAITEENFNGLPGTIQASGADCFFYGGFTQSGAAEMFHAVADANPGIKMFGADGVAEAAFTEQFGPELAAQIFITNPTLPADEYPESAQAFFDEFESTYGHAPEPYAIYGYEAMNVALLAIENAGEQATPDAAGRAAVVAQFFQIEDRESVLGTYSIDQNGDTTLTDFGGYMVKDGALVFDEVIEAAPSSG